LPEALAAAREIENGYDRADALADLAPRLAELGHPQEALAAAREIGDESYRAEALAGLAPHLPEGLLPEALAAAWEIGGEFARAQALAGLAPHLPPDLKEEALREALAAAREIENGYARAKALAGLAGPWAEWAGRERAAAYALWPETLRRLAVRPRKDLLSDLRALLPVLSALGGAEAVGEAFRAIQDVGRWWP
jgi:hypothetical protein